MSETGNGRKNWTRVVAAVGLVFLAVAIALLIGLLFGIVQGFLVSYLEIQPFIVSLAGMFFGRGMTSIISTDMISIKNATFMAWAKYKIYMPFGSYSKRGKFLPAYIYPTVIIAIIVLIVIIIVMKYTKFGRSVYAIGGNEQSALMMGLNVKRTKMAAYLLDGFLAGLGGFLFCMNSCAGFVEQAKGLEMDAISAAVIGGTLLSGGVGTPFGTLFGVLIKGTISSLITAQGTYQAGGYESYFPHSSASSSFGSLFLKASRRKTKQTTVLQTLQAKREHDGY